MERAPVRILVADDHEVVREGLGHLLSGEPNFELVGFACDGDEAVRKAETSRPDVILMDLVMPVLDGVGAIHRLRERGVDCAVVVLTTFLEESKVRQALDAGATGYLLKDVAKDELKNAIRTAAEGGTVLHPEAQEILIRPGSTNGAALEALTDRELDVLRLIASGKSNKAIAKALFLTVGTVKGYVSKILGKLGVRDRTQAALYAVREGLVDPAGELMAGELTPPGPRPER